MVAENSVLREKNSVICEKGGTVSIQLVASQLNGLYLTSSRTIC